MKKAFLIAAAAALVSTGALAQTSQSGGAGGTSGAGTVPSFQAGSGQQSGGPAKELNTSGSMTTAPGTMTTAPGSDVRATGTVRGEIDSSNTRQSPQTQNAAPVPSYQQGSGQQAGGPAKELNSSTGTTRP